MHARKQVATVIWKVAAAASLGVALLLVQSGPARSGPASHDPWKLEQVRVGGSTVVNATGRCEACHTLDPDGGENGTSFISNTARTLAMMKLAKGGAFTLSENFGCTFCHSARLDNATMDDVLADFDSTTIKHPIGRLVDGVTNTNNEYLSTYGSGALANELQCNQCHNTAFLTYPSHEGRASGDPAAWAGTWDKTANPNALLNVTVAADAEKNHCVNTCHGDLGAGNSATKPKMGHYGWGGYNGTNIYDPSGQALQAAATATCTVCHDTHTSTKADLTQDGLDLGQPDPGRTAINENTCVAVCHAIGQFNLYGHGGKVGISSTLCTPCHTTAVTHRDTTDEASARRMVYVDPVKGNLTMSLAADGLDNDMDGLKDVDDAVDEGSFAYSKSSNCKTCHMHYAGHGSATRAAACMDCHDPHGDAAVGNAAMIRTSIYGEPTSFTAAERAAGTYYRSGFNNGVCDNNLCHSNIAGDLSTAHKGGTGAILAQPCTDCHNMTHTDPQAADTDEGFLVTKCSGCHFAAADTDNWNITDTVPAKISSTEWTGAGHGRTTAYLSGNPAGNFGGPASDAPGCAYCHSFLGTAPNPEVLHGVGTNPFRLANKGTVGTEAERWNQVCLVCHATGDPGYDPDGTGADYGSRNGTRNVGENHFGLDHTLAGQGGAFCWDCHDPHGDTQHYMVHTGDGSAPGRGVTSVSDGTYGIPTSSRIVENLNVVGGYTSADLISATGTGLCQTCHAAGGTGASYFYRGAAPPASAAHNAYDTTLCTSCHVHDGDFTASCAGCHGNEAAGNFWPDGSNANAENSAGRHPRHMTVLAARLGITLPGTAAQQKQMCDYCHPASTNDGDHGVAANLPAEVFPVSYRKSLWNAVDADAAYVAATDVCNNVDCHAGRQTTDGTFGWYDAGTMTCAMCHDVAPATGKHVGHLASNSLPGATAQDECLACHDTTMDTATTPDTPFGYSTTNLHVNGTNNVAFDALYDYEAAGGTGTSGTGAAMTCSGVRCHNGVTTPAWGAASITCGQCHGDGLGTANSEPGPTMTPSVTGSHAAHIDGTAASYTDCDNCHGASGVTVSGTYTATGGGGAGNLHQNLAVNMWINGAANRYDDVAPAPGDGAGGVNYLAADANHVDSGQCSATVCHSAGTPTWGGTLANLCFDCHQGFEATGKPQIDTTPNFVDRTQYETYGHGRTGSNYPGTNNLPAGYPHDGVTNNCYSCHNSAAEHSPAAATDPYRLGAFAQNTNGLCDTCHGASGTATVVDIVSHTKTITGSGKDWPGTPDYDYKCVDCHDPHGDSNWAMIRIGISAPETAADADGFGSDNYGSTLDPASVQSVVFTSMVGMGPGSYGVATIGVDGICEVCHTQTTYWRKDVVAEGHYPTLRCTTCHTHPGGFKAACDACHGNDTNGTYWPDGSTVAAENSAGRHPKHITVIAARLGYSSPFSDAQQKEMCEYCHQASTNDADHGVAANLPAEVFPASYRKSLWNAADADATYRNPSMGAPNDVCQNVDCHAGTQTTDGAYGWYDATGGSCTLCHEVSSITTNKHAQHLNSHALPGNAANECYVCHEATIESTGNLITPIYAPGSPHINGSVNVQFNVYADYEAAGGTAATGTGTATTCSGIKCHNGVTTPAWGAASITCGQCHGDGTGTANSEPGPTMTVSVEGNHAAHIDGTAASYTDCDNCHGALGTTVSGTYTATGGGGAGNLHQNLAVNMWINGAANRYDDVAPAPGDGAGGVNYLAADANHVDNGQCSATVCHSADTPTWGGTLPGGCFACHTGVEANAKPLVDAVPNPVVNAGQYDTYGHGRPTASGNYPGSGNPPANYVWNGGTNNCYSCHDAGAPHAPAASGTDPFRLGANAQNTNAVCNGCHLTGPAAKIDIVSHTKTITGSGKDWPGTPDYDYKCVDCHDPHGDLNYMMVRSHLSAPETSADADGFGSDNYGTPLDPTSVAAVTFNNLTGMAAGSYGITLATVDGICEVCHTQTAYWRKDVAQEAHNPTTRCTVCHDHRQGLKAACYSCHGDGATEYWPQNATNLRTTDSNASFNDDGEHTLHIARLATRLGYTLPGTDAQQKAMCAYCHVLNDYDHTSLTNATQAEVFVSNAVRGAKSLWNVDDTNAVFTTTGNAYSCQNVDCHDQQDTGTTYNWYTGAASACVMCHVDVTSAAADPNAHVSHTESSGIYGRTIGCNDCHVSGVVWGTVPPSTGHIDGVWTIQSLAGSYNGSWPTTKGSCGAGGQNSCHSNGAGGVPVVSAYSWGTALNNDCASCHQGTAIASGKHNGHLGSNSLPGTNLTYNTVDECVGCHSTSADGLGKAAGAVHLNQAVNVSFSSTYDYEAAGGTGTTGTGAAMTCSDIRCHNGVTTPAWGAVGITCGQCHGDGLGTANSEPAPTMTPSVWGSHAAHIDGTAASYTDCAQCHANATLYTATGGQAAHQNLTVNVSIAVATYTDNVTIAGDAGGVNYLAAGTTHTDNGTCAFTSGCHNTASPTWGGALAGGCFDCHTGAEANAKPLVDAVANPVTLIGQYDTYGHGRPTASGNYPGSGNAPANYLWNGGTNNCYSCHDAGASHAPAASATDPYRLGANAQNTNAVCDGCHLTGPAARIDIVSHSKTITGSSKDWPGTPDYDYKCVDCHDPHGDLNYMMVRSHLSAPETSADADGFGSDNYGTPLDPTSVAAVTFNNLTGMAAGSYGITLATVDGICEVCHTQTAYWRKDVAQEAHNPTTRCTSCHDHKQGFKSTCDACHGGGTSGTVTKNYWPDASNANPENNPAGAHLAHINDLSQRIYGLTAVALLNNAAADTRQKHLCKYCHGNNPGGDADHSLNPGTNRADVPAGGIHPLWSTADPPTGDDGAYVSATLTCTTTDCHYNRTTPGWESGTAATCTTCHFNTLDNGALSNSWPDVGTAGTGDHFAHYAALGGEFTTLYGATNTLCVPCHNTQQPATTFADIVTMASHIDGDRFGDATIASVAGAYDDKSAGVAAYGGLTADDTCADVSCHGGITTPAWQTGTITTTTVVTAECQKCHTRENVLTVPLGTEYNTARSGAHVDHDFGCNTCHSAVPTNHYAGIATTALDNTTNIVNATYFASYTDLSTGFVAATNGYFFDGAGGSSGTCATVTCHNNQASVAWNASAASSATCNFCHLDTPTSNSHPAHVYGTPGTADLTDCNQCHPSATYAVAATGTDANFISPGTHANLAIDKLAALGASGSGGTLTCTTNPCHARETTTSWNNTTVPMSCNSCHYYAAAPAAGSNVGAGALGGTHNAHFFGAPASIVCTDCHADNSADVNDKRTHMRNTGANDGAVLQNKAAAFQDEADVTAGALGTGSDPDMAPIGVDLTSNPTCNTALCHNPSPGAAYSATWNGAPNNSCGFCHADTTGDPATGSHTKHISYASGYAPCTQCHVDNGTTYTHMDRNVDLAVSLTYSASLNPPYDNTSWGSCSAGACHDTAADPAWGQVQGVGITDCAVCHSDGTQDTNNYDGTDGTASEVMNGLQWSTYGHGAKAGANSCGACHSFSVGHSSGLAAAANPFRLGMSYTGSDAFCSNTSTCHTGALSSVAISHTDEGMTADQRTWPAWNPKCVDCHDPHGDGANLAMIQADLFDRGSSTHGLPTTPKTTDAVVFTSKADIAAGSYANSTDADGICQECHLANDGVATNMLSFLDDDPTPLAPSHPNAGLSPCTSCHVHAKAFEPAACEACHDATPYVKGSATAPNVMGDGVLFGGDTGHTTPQPYDDGSYGYNVNGHGRDNDTSTVSHGDPIGVACTACHDVSQPAGTHLDGVLNGRLTPSDTRNANSFHLVPGFIKASPTSEWDVQVTFDNYCYNTCHTTGTTDMRHALDAIPALYAMQLGTHSSYDPPLNTPPPEMFYDRNLKSAATFGGYDGLPNFALCVSCHNPHGTNTVSPRSDLNNKMAIYKWSSPAQLCAKCH